MTTRWNRKDLLGLRELSAEEINFILETTDAFKQVGTREIKKVPALRGKTLINFFVEPSTRTRTSFELAAQRLSADIVNISVSTSSLAKGETLHPLSILSGGARRTLFKASLTPAAARKRWIAGVLRPEGALVIDDGAVRALKEGKSLLPAGIRQIDGRFERGDAVVVKDRDGREVARGLAAYNASDAERIAGKRTVEIEAILGYRGRDEMIHRDDLILTGNGT